VRYTNVMQLVVFVVLAIVVALVAIDAIGRLDERRPPKKKRDPSLISTQKIVVDLSKRR
jgi:membrane protein implicated in regulation of membrane protease activity